MTTLFLVVVLLLAIATTSNAALDISVNSDNGVYYLAYSIGNPPVSVSGNLIAGSDLTWLPCDFDLNHSSTYSRIPCSSSRCKALPATTCSTENTCNYNMTYADGSSTSGDFSTDAVSFFDSTERFAFGCATKYGGNPMASVGLGRGKSSLVQQLGATKFSYCLVPFAPRITTSGKLRLGDEAEVSGGVSTPLVPGSSPSFYYASVESIAIGKQTLRFDGIKVLVELGTPMTMVPLALYESMIDAVKLSMPAEKKIIDGSDLCYSDMTGFPSASVQFEGGASVEWKAENVFAQMGENKFCVAFGQADDGADAIYGSFAQANFVVGFDLAANTVNFKPATC